MPVSRQSEKTADWIDFMIFDALRRIGRMIETDTPDRVEAWRATVALLRDARSAVRPLMNPERERETRGEPTEEKE
jgi:hypothetical protein